MGLLGTDWYKSQKFFHTNICNVHRSWTSKQQHCFLLRSRFTTSLTLQVLIAPEILINFICLKNHHHVHQSNFSNSIFSPGMLHFARTTLRSDLLCLVSNFQQKKLFPNMMFQLLIVLFFVSDAVIQSQIRSSDQSSVFLYNNNYFWPKYHKIFRTPPKPIWTIPPPPPPNR